MNSTNGFHTSKQPETIKEDHNRISIDKNGLCAVLEQTLQDDRVYLSAAITQTGHESEWLDEVTIEFEAQKCERFAIKASTHPNQVLAQTSFSTTVITLNKSGLHATVLDGPQENDPELGTASGLYEDIENYNHPAGGHSKMTKKISYDDY